MIFQQKQYLCIILISLLMIGCGNNRNTQQGDLITINLNARFPQKELIIQDFMDIEYIILEDLDDFVTQGLVLDVSPAHILVRNRISDGNIYIFDRNGNAVRIINRMGQGSEEYNRIVMAFIDEDNEAIFVADFERMMVYDIYGNYLRSFSIRNISWVSRFDEEHLIGIDSSVRMNEESTESQPFVLISKQDGSIIKRIHIDLEQGINPFIGFDIPGGGFAEIYLPGNFPALTPAPGNWLLSSLASDTIFRLLPDFTKEPFMVRTPPIHSMRTKTFMSPILVTEDFFFLFSLDENIRSGERLVYSVQENAAFRFSLYNGDFLPAREVTMQFHSAFRHNREIAFIENIEAYQLLDAYENGELSGRLKEIASQLHDDSNPVIMLIKHRK